MLYFVTVGDTVRLKATFRDWDDVLTDPTTVTFTVYNATTMAQVSTEALGSDHKITTGVWESYWTPTTVGVYFCEMKGTLQGSQIARRVRLEVRNIV